MTSISSFRLFQCPTCGQKHILPNYGTVNLMMGDWPSTPKAEDLVFCQRCAVQKPLHEFMLLRTLDKPRFDNSPKWLRRLRKLFNKNYKEPDPHPMNSYPDLDSKPFNAETYFSGSIKKYMDEYDAYPIWYKDLIKNQKIKKSQLKKL